MVCLYIKAVDNKMLEEREAEMFHWRIGENCIQFSVLEKSRKVKYKNKL